MHGQTLVKINEHGKVTKGTHNKGLLIGIWRGLKVSDKELEQATKAPFNFEVEKYVR